MKDDEVEWTVTANAGLVHLWTSGQDVSMTPESALVLSEAISRRAQDAIRMRARRLSEAAQALVKQENARHQ